MPGIVPQSGQRLIDGDYVNGLANGQNYGFVNSLTAHAGGGQANALPLPLVGLVEVDTVANANDSVQLPLAAQAGVEFVVINNGANSMNVYASPAGNPQNGGATDTINGGANANPVAIASKATTVFFCAKPGLWFTK